MSKKIIIGIGLLVVIIGISFLGWLFFIKEDAYNENYQTEVCDIEVSC